MKASMLCGAHYEGAEAHFHRAPVSPTQCDPDIARQSFDHFLDYAALADEVGYDWVSVSEHHYSPLILAPSVAPLAGALTQIVRRAKIALLGPLVSINNPVRIAEEIAMLDQLSHGRLVVLPLRGTPGEFNTYEPLDASITQAKTQEATKLIRQALRDVEPFSWDSEFFHFPKVGIWPRALQRPFPPMYFSGNSLNSAVFAAREHLGVCLSFHRPEVVARTVATYRSEALSAGWEPSSEQVVYRGFALVADTDERAAELEAVFLPPPLRFLLNGPVPGPISDDTATRHALPTQAAEAGPTPFGMGRMLFVGSPDTVVERVRAFHAATGVGVVDLVFSSGQISPGDVQRSIELFGREVLPRIRDLGVAQDIAGAAQVGAENHDPGRHR
jgi:alkanesulfonate monooxygenase SsuD/methylene tetrahydromethanopterin reductase-like flavin-dependent oxidoreductase (luciferase family)